MNGIIFTKRKKGARIVDPEFVFMRKVYENAGSVGFYLVTDYSMLRLLF